MRLARVRPGGAAVSPSLKQALLARLDADQEHLIAFMRDFLRSPSANPPGDTLPAAATISRYLEQRGAPFQILAAKPHLPNLVGDFQCGAPGRHLVLNGHIDVFPPNDENGWSGDLRDGKLFGRGASDMKCGTAAGIFTYAYLHDIREQLNGRLTLTAVSDEQTGGRWGTRWLLETHPELVTGDCFLNGEPSGINNVRFMEKGTLRFIVTIKTPGGHGGYPHLSESATKIAARLMIDLDRFHGLMPTMPADVTAVLTAPETVAVINAGLGQGAADIVRQVTVNFGVVRGGRKINQIPDECVVEVDIRIPVGMDTAVMRQNVANVIARYPEARFDVVEDHSYPASSADPNGEMVKIIQANVQALKGFTPLPSSSLGGSDSRWWRYRGVPAYLYGPSPVSMGRSDEHVTVEEFLHVVRTHVLSAFDYLSR